MKLWEVIKELTEDPEKVFRDKNGWSIKFAKDGRLEFFDRYGGSVGFHVIKSYLLEEDDWQLVRQPVTWQEAIQAWAEGKKAVWEEGAERRVFDRNKIWTVPIYQSHLLDQDGDAVKVRMISGGKWYVED